MLVVFAATLLMLLLVPLAGLDRRHTAADSNMPWKSLGVTVVLLLLLACEAGIAVRRRLAIFRRDELRARYTRTLLDSMRDAVVVADPANGRVLDLNSETERLTGYSRASLLSMSTVDLRVPEEQEAARAGIAAADVAAISPAPRRIAWQAKDGSRLHIEVVLGAVTLESGMVAVLGSAREISEQLRAENEIATRVRQQAAVAQLGTLALVHGDERVLISTATELIAEVLDVELVVVLELSTDGTFLRPRAAHGWDERFNVASVSAQAGATADSALSHAGFTLLSDAPVIVDDFRTDPRNIYTEVLQQNGVVSGIALAIRGSTDPYGTLAVYSRSIRSFSADDLRFLESIANILGATIERARTAAALSARRAQQTVLAELGELALAGESLDTLLDSASRRVAAALEAQHCVYAEPQDDGRTVLLRAGSDRQLMTNRQTMLRGDVRSVIGLSFATQTTIVCEDLLHDPRFDPGPLQVKFGIRSAICAPVPGKTGTLGLLSVSSTRRRRYSADDVRFLEAAAHILATAVERRRAEEALQTSEAKYRLIVETAQEGIWAIDAGGTTTFVNSCMATMLGEEPATLLGRSLQDLLASRSDREGVEARLERSRRGLAEQYEVELQRADGSVIWVAIASAPLRDESGAHAGSLAMVTDLSEKRRAEEFHRQATHDGLTGLPNRRLLADRLQLSLKSAQRSGQPVTILYLDLDRFKQVNDDLGHEAGDEVLVQTGQRLAALLRASDTVARLGGDEFAIVLPDTDDTGADAAAQRVIEALREPFTVADGTVSIGASVGAAQFPRDGADPKDLLQQADKAMYRAKRAGGGVTVYAGREPSAETAA